MAFFATLGLLFLLVIRPQEIWPWLEALHLLDLFTALAAIGVGIEIFSGRQKRPYSSPQIPFLIGFLVISYATTLIAVGSSGFGIATKRSLIAAIFMLVFMYGSATHARLRTIAAVLTIMAVFISLVCIHQGGQEPICILLDPEDLGASENGEPDGRECTTAWSCYTMEGAVPEGDYACERIGMFRTVSVVRRVRWRGQLNDPNELAVFLGCVIPLLLALTAEVRKTVFTILAFVSIGIFFYCVILTQSRGGQLVVGAVFASYFISRFGWKGAIAGALFALPVVLLGGRSDRMADESAEERLGLLYDGIGVFFQYPIRGVGIDQFMEFMRKRQTAHNAYLLAGAELGLPGFWCWTGIMWTSAKIGITAAVRKTTPAALKPLAVGLVVSFIGMAVGIFFLSFTFKQLLFIWFGLAGAFYRYMKTVDEEYEVVLGFKDYFGMFAFNVFILIAIYVYTRIRPPGDVTAFLAAISPV